MEKELTQSILSYARENKTSVKNVMDPYNKFSPLDSICKWLGRK